MKKLGRPRKFAEDTHRFAVVLPKSLLQKLRVIANDKVVPVPVSHLIQIALTRYVDEHSESLNGR